MSATFVTPYPPGFPVLVPGQLVSPEVLSFMCALDVKEIHGYRPHLGYRVYIEKALQQAEQPVPAPTFAAAGVDGEAQAG